MKNENGQFKRGSLIKDLTGEKFNKWEVIEFSHVDYGKKNRRTYWKAQCECGTIKIIRADSLKTTISCGCHKQKVDSEKAKELRELNLKYDDKKALSRHPLYHKWNGMKKRCYKPSDAHYNNYGARGITICEEWRESFLNFYNWGINNGYKQGLEIDRINNDGNYEPSNCRFISRKENCNNRNTTRKFTFNNQIHSITEWAEILNLDVKKIYYLLDIKKLSFEEVLKELQVNTEVTL